MSRDGEPDGAGAAFWRFSLSVYGQEGVPELCISLQDDHGADVNVLLYLLFRAVSGDAFDTADIARLDAGIAPWREEVVRPLRAVRRALKTPALAGIADDDDALRQRIKAVELEAERRQQFALARIGAAIPARALPSSEAAGASWLAYGRHLRADLPAPALARLKAAMDGA